MKRALALVALAWIAGCKSATPPAGFGVDLVIDGRMLAKRDSVGTLAVGVTGSETYTTSVDGTPIAQGGLARVRYVPAVGSGTLSFAIEAMDASSVIVGSGTGSATLVAGQAVVVTITLADGGTTDGGAGDGGPIADMTMLPATCTNGTLDPGEVDVDCGGSCARCEPGKICKVDSDCATRTCGTTSGQCELTSGPPFWLPATSLPAGRLFSGAATLDTSTYVAGGFTGAIDGTTLRSDFDDNDWCGTCGSAIAPGALKQPRQGLSVVAASGHLFAIGGYDQVGTTQPVYASIESFDPATQAWSTALRTLTTARVNLAAAIGADKLVYTVGGMSSASTGALANVESFDPANDAATPATVQPALPTARGYLAASNDSLGRVLAIGGLLADIATTTSEVDVFDTTTKMWKAGASMSAARCALGAALGADGRVYAVGGQDSTGATVSTVEALMADAKQWTELPPIMTRTGLDVVQGWDGRIYAIGGASKGGLTLYPTVEAYGPVVSPGQPSAAAGSTVVIGLDNFAASANITVTFSGDAPGVVAVSGNTDSSGKITSLVWHVPNVKAGSYTLSAVDDRSRYPVRATFVVQ